MAVKVYWTRQAREDLREIRAFIARNAPVTAVAFIRRIRESVKRVQIFPEIGQVVPELGRSDIREFLHGTYRVIYRVGAKRVDVLVEVGIWAFRCRHNVDRHRLGQPNHRSLEHVSPIDQLFARPAIRLVVCNVLARIARHTSGRSLCLDGIAGDTPYCPRQHRGRTLIAHRTRIFAKHSFRDVIVAHLRQL